MPEKTVFISTPVLNGLRSPPELTKLLMVSFLRSDIQLRELRLFIEFPSARRTFPCHFCANLVTEQKVHVHVPIVNSSSDQ